MTSIEIPILRDENDIREQTEDANDKCKSEYSGYRVIEEPSKKPSERIEELANEVELPFAGSLVDMVNAKCIGIAKYLDELHSQGKTIGCNECVKQVKALIQEEKERL